MATRTKTDRCELFDPTTLEWVWHNVILFYLAFFLGGLIHEVGHGIGNGLTGGDFGLASNVGFLGGYGLINIYVVVPVFFVHFAEVGNRYVMLLAGPLSLIFLAWYVGLTQNINALDGPCGGRNKWMRRRGIVWGLLLRAGFDSVYLLPIDVFPNGISDGDGMALHHMFVQDGFVVRELFGLPWFFSAGHIIGGLAIIGTLYVAWRVASCAPELCGSCKI